MKQLLPLIKKYMVFAILSPLFMILEVLGDVIIPYLMAKIVDVGIANQDIDYIVRIGMMMIGVALIAMTLGVASSFFGSSAGYGFAAEIRQNVFEKVQSFSFANLDTFQVSSLITRLTNDCNTIGQVTMMSLRMAIRAPFMMIFALFMAFKVNSSLARVFLISLPLLTIAITVALSKARPLFLILQTYVDKVNGVIQENLTNIRVVKSFNRQSFEESKFKVKNDGLMNTALKAITYVILLMPIFSLIVYSTIIAVLWFGGKQITLGSMSGGALISFVTYITQVLMSLMMISMYFMNLLRGSASVSRIVEVLNTESEIKEISNPVKEVKDGSISFENVSFIYPGSSEFTLKNINFSISSGETLGIIGSTGSSKSTLVQLIPRLYDVTEGKVKVGGVDVRDYDLELLRDKVSFVLQKNTLFSGTIRSNMKWGNENAADEEIIEALKHAQAWEFVSNYDDGLDHIVEQNGDNYSGGQKQRLTIARALMKSPKAIILDDSTSAVDMTTDAKIQKAFKQDLADVTTIIIAQRISSIQHADRIIVMHEGKIESIGSHDDLIQKSPIYQEIYESQQKGVIGE
ncbi:ABC transporter ATP-binding protein [Dehalobacterium formicoaceticum]|uniref:ABC transporter ATP-binding protein/permease n=1 Tax=Dehalobacterium formicoaceticum TaxID=51515 RepID=A0ABT1Y6L2_9FIRM|nr:ABC transporter ATP-binding protein [Dehalobacterium formicoaceticum]MCR6546529.1 ABC transporter ATP-binding protein/permease [Dehalobacterium formicoaceticum]